MESQKHNPKQTKNNLENKEHGTTLQEFKTLTYLLRREIAIIAFSKQYKLHDSFQNQNTKINKFLLSYLQPHHDSTIGNNYLSHNLKGAKHFQKS